MHSESMFKSFMKMPGVLLPASLVFFQAMMGALTIYLRVANRRLTLTTDSEIWILAGIVLISFVFHIILQKKNLLSFLWGWCHAIFTVQFFLILILLDFVAFNKKVTDEPYFAFSSFGVMPKGFILLTYSLLTALIAQIVFWVCTAFMLLKSAKQKSA